MKLLTNYVSLVVLLLVFTPRISAAPSPYTVTVPAQGQFFAAWHFATADLEDVIVPDAVPHGITVQIWNNATQNWVIQSLEDFDENWPNPGYDITPGTVFFIQNPTIASFTVTFAGTEVSGSAQVILKPGDWNGYASPKLPGDMLENLCMYDSGMGFPGVNGDMFYWWNPTLGEWVISERGYAVGGFSWGGTCDGGIIGKGYNGIWVSQPGWGAFFDIVGTTNRVWTYAAPIEP